MNDTMNAVLLRTFGGPDVLGYEEAPTPIPQRHEVLVRVHAASLNPPDLYLRDGYRALPPAWRPDARFPLILGTDVSGEVMVRSNGTQLAEAGRLLDDGTLRVVIDSTFALAQASDAHHRASQGGIQGKIVLIA